MRRAPLVRLHAKDQRWLLAVAHDPGISDRLRQRARIVLQAAAGGTNREIAIELSTDAGTVARWRRRFVLHGTAGILRDAPRPGRPATIPEAKVGFIIRAGIGPQPSPDPTWSTRRLAREVGVSKSTVHRIWRARGIRLHHLPRPAPREGGMRFLEDVTDMVGVYLNPPERAIAFATDEGSGAPKLGPGVFRPLDRLRRRHQGIEFRAFLQIVDRETPANLEVHLLLDHRLAPAPPELDRWLRQHPRIHLHYLPSDRPGVTLIDRLVSDFSRGRPRADEPPSVRRLRYAIREHFRAGGGPTAPFVWTTTAEEVRRSPGPPDVQ